MSSDVLTVDLNGVHAGVVESPRVESLGPGRGYVVHNPDGTTSATPAAARTMAAQRRERLLATDVTRMVSFEHEGEAFTVATWGRDDRQLWRESLHRAGAGESEFVLSETGELTDTEKLTLVTLIHGVRDDLGQPFFSVADVMEYRKNGEDDALMAALLGAVVENNPRVFGDGATVETEKKTT